MPSFAAPYDRAWLLLGKGCILVQGIPQIVLTDRRD